MNGKQIAILAIAVAVMVGIVWHDLPLEFPMIIMKALMLFLKVSLVAAVAVFAYLFIGRKKSQQE
ncbi:MAG TPA: hypothetical protein P5117_00595 [Spirochaetia bacterium]|nr:hypothetical protein [Spirochaetia bacterium]